MTIKDLLDYDAKHIWHPYTSIAKPLPVYPVESASQCTIRLMDGREVIDGMSSWWAVIHGYNHPILNQVVQEQIAKMSHVMFGGFTHEPAVQLSKTLIDITPKGLTKVFFSDSGSVAVEVAMKMAIQYWYAKERPEKNKFVTIKSAYHGDTWNAMSVSDPTTGMHQLYHGNLPIHYFAEQPKTRFGQNLQPQDIDSLKNIIEQNHGTIAAMMIEPIVQGAGGMWFYSAEYLKQAYELCKAYDILFICDEIATGLGRTGELFAVNHSGISPDIMCLGKALTGGYLSFAATLTNDDVAETISAGQPGVFMHGPTFMGNPLACAVANASINLLLNQDWKKIIQNINNQLVRVLNPCKKLAQVADVRVMGAIGVVETKKAVNVAEIQKQFVARGVWIRPFGKLVYVMPPYIMKDEEIEKLGRVIFEVLE